MTAVGVDLDLASLTSIRGLPGRLSDTVGDAASVDVLINNAQGASPLYTENAANGNSFERATTEDGFDRIIGTAYLGHYALVGALLPALKRSTRGFRIINVSSESHRSATRGSISYALECNLDIRQAPMTSVSRAPMSSDLDMSTKLDGDLGMEKHLEGGLGVCKLAPYERYSIAKAANILFAVELQRRIEEASLPASAVVVGLHDPRQDLLHPVESAANAHVWLAAAADSGGSRARRGGVYFSSESHEPTPPSEATTDARLARKLWDVSEKLTGVAITL